MIAYIKGIVAEIQKDGIVLESQNMGYRIFMPASSLQRLGKTGEEKTIHTYLHVKEDAMQLYGFLKKEDLAVFRLLLGVSGVGPKGAMGILSCLSGEDLSFAILSDDAAAIAKAPGIGKKTAQKVILELKDKMNLQEAFEQKISKGFCCRPGGSGGAGSAGIWTAGGMECCTPGIRRGRRECGGTAAGGVKRDGLRIDRWKRE